MAKIKLTLPVIGSGGGSDPLKLDKDGYTGTAKDIDDRILVLENQTDVDNAFITKPTFSLSANTLTIGALGQWRLLGVAYSNPTSVDFPITFCTTGKTRLVYFVPNSANGFTQVSGTETLGIAIQPQLPNENLYVTYVLVSDSGVGEPVIPPAFATPSLQQITDVGAVTTKPITVIDYSLNRGISIWNNVFSFWKRISGVPVTVNTFIDDVSESYNVQFPNKTGGEEETFAMVSDLTKSQVGLSNVDNTSDANKPVSTAQQAALDLKANLLDAIPLTGTTVGNPVSGEIEVLETAKGIWSKGGSYPDDYSGIFLGEGSSGLYFRNLFDNNEVSIRTYDSGVVISDNRLTAIGLSGEQNFSPNITDLDYPQKIYVDTGLSSKLDASAYNQYFKGVYLTLAALIAAHPTGVAGDSAQVNEVGATDVINYSWDAEENIWVAGGGTGGAANTDALPEGSTNLYWTVARFLANLTAANIKAALGITTLSGSNTGDQDLSGKQNVLVSGTNIKTLDGDSLLGSGNLLPKTELAYALADETSNLTVGTLITFRMPFAMTLSEVRISLNDAPTISSVIVDVKENGVSIFSTLLSIDASEKTSVTAATPAVISDINLADDAEITVETTQIGSGDTGKGLKILFKGRKA